MKKKTVSNCIMVAAILLIVSAGILIAFDIQGLFDTDDGSQAVLSETRGVVELLRGGVSFPLSEKTVLRNADQITCQSGASAVINAGTSKLTLGEKASVTVTSADTEALCIAITSGEVFADCETPVTLSFDTDTVTLENATAHLSVRSSAQSLSILRGSFEDITAGQALHYIGQERSASPLDIHSLNDFTISGIRRLSADRELYFNLADLDALQAERQAALQALLNETPASTDSSTQPVDPPQPTAQEAGKGSAQVHTEPVQSTAPSSPAPVPDSTEAVITTEAGSTDEGAVPTETAAQTEPPATPAGSCTIAIYCETILNNMDELEPGKAEFVPENGTILSPVTVAFYEGETVFEVLQRVCGTAGIQLEYSWTPLYNSYYVEGINNLYEFDCGFESGWMYKVNGWFPNYGCSSYSLKDGDVIVWAYTCKGLGTDVGAPRME